MRRKPFVDSARVAMLVVLAIVAGATGCGGSGGGNDTAEALLYVPEQAHYGATYGEWSARWWTWAMEIPFSTSPLADETGANAALGQVDPVWFLGGEIGNSFNTPDGTAVRTFSIPKGRALFFPIVNDEVDNDFCTPPDWVPLSPSDLAAWHNKPTYDVRDVYCIVDDVVIVDSPDGESAQRFRAKSGAFSFLMPADNVASTYCGAPFEPLPVDPAYSDGLWIMLAPLPPGEHTIRFGGKFPPFPGGWSLDITYHITVLP